MQKPSEKCFKPKQSHHRPPPTFVPMSDIERLTPMPLRLEGPQPDGGLPVTNLTLAQDAEETDASPPATSQPDEKKASSADVKASPPKKQQDNRDIEETQPKTTLAIQQNEGIVQQLSLQENTHLARSPQLTSVHSGSQGIGLSVPRHSFSNAVARQQNDTASRQQNSSFFFQQGNQNVVQQGNRGGGPSLGVAQEQGQGLVGGGHWLQHQHQQGGVGHLTANAQPQPSVYNQGQEGVPLQQGAPEQPFVGSFQQGNGGPMAVAQGNNNNNFQQSYGGAGAFIQGYYVGGPFMQGYYGGGCMGPSGFNPHGGYNPSLQYGGAVSNQQVSCADSASSGIPPVVHADALRRGGDQLVHGHSLRTSDVQEDAADDDDITGVEGIDMQRMQIHLTSRITAAEGNIMQQTGEILNQGRHREDNAAARHQEAEENANARDRGLHDRYDSQDAIADARHRELMECMNGIAQRVEKKKSKSWMRSRSKGN